MKTAKLVGAVVAGHCVVIGSILLMQGCGTTGPVSSAPQEEYPMPGPTPPTAPDVATHAPTPTPKHTPVAAAAVKAWPSDTTAYTVQKGDSISLICSRFHVSRAEVMALNHITDANKIVVGQDLQLPGKVNLGAPAPVKKPKAVAAATSKPKATTAPAATSTEGVYVVKAGDALSKIASHHGTTVAALKAANGLKSDRINVGQKLKMPGASATASAAPAATATPVEASPATTTLPGMAAPASTPITSGDADADVASAPTVGADAGAAAVAAATPATTATPAAATTFRTHTVEPGEDLYHVSLMWDVSVEELQRVNGLTGTALTPGQQLQIPMPQ